ncbi:MAG: excinuclease ABC subunit UvrB [Dehalococcoidia bacterium]|jgi:excinuclease ABC subunit B|uniref:UvrABC system protein B n=1 Tax=marine metagenome TaxID=408172 RepID=A0A381QDJ4_9ZZZZ|nr:excinuclease ABC subunit B [Dehalococcoidia bacterium]MBV46934.1 excinuclease ABC subunit B [Dehalococcoidia bacterium]MCS5648539.1 excinuclease ABC subunit UvrB [Dehalococcoidia bacterium]MEC7913747.1 excinuclease ABC subunit UvrB [Chloroflexota bacterium]HBR64744.1 excinuclease ABC subunit B [Dehalococcoidia bacterium]|tara:strand:- start:3736 stop:5721 length:1986 start_codon:yes stop_codon:yes gene_type:complete
MPEFKLSADFTASGDQPTAVSQLSEGISKGFGKQTLLGVTGSGKTYTMACIVEKIQKPTLVIAHNKTLAAQLATEFKEFFPENAVEYFVSYYDYYQPEAYVPRTDTYIEKDADINEELDKLRHSATRSLLTRKDVLIVASVSCIFGLGAPEEYQGFVASVKKGESKSQRDLIRKLVDMQYERNDYDLARGRFRVRGDTLEILPAYEQLGIRIEFWGDEVEKITHLDTLTGEIIGDKESVEIYPAKHFVTSKEKLQMAIRDIGKELELHLKHLKSSDKLLEAQRLESRTKYDLEMLEIAGYCAGVENYSRHLSQRAAGSTPYTLLDYFPDDFLLFVDESHMTLPQLRAMYRGDQSRKETLVEYGFRLPSALDNRPLNFGEFEKRVNQVVFVSATPGPYEMENSSVTAEQVIRPTGLLDPFIEVKPVTGQIDDLLDQIDTRVKKGERILVTTLTKRMSEELSDYLKESGIRTQYLHSEIDTLERSEILRDLRMGVYDVLVGINLLREGLDLPEVSLVAILDADKEGFLRSRTSLIQTIGRASRHIDGKVIMYADKMTDSMKNAIEETDRRRLIQQSYNEENGITPQGIRKTIRDITERVKSVVEPSRDDLINGLELPKEDLIRLIKDLQLQMKSASKDLEFEKAAIVRDQILDLRKIVAEEPR